jgi:hypothetical protein
LGAMGEAQRRCEWTGLSVPECSCPACCEALLHSASPPLPTPTVLRVGGPGKALPSGGPLWLAQDFAAGLKVSVVDLRAQAQAREVEF